MFDTVMSARVDAYHGLNVDNIAMLQDNCNFTACLQYDLILLTNWYFVCYNNINRLGSACFNDFLS